MFIFCFCKICFGNKCFLGSKCKSVHCVNGEYWTKLISITLPLNWPKASVVAWRLHDLPSPSSVFAITSTLLCRFFLDFLRFLFNALTEFFHFTACLVVLVRKAPCLVVSNWEKSIRSAFSFEKQKIHDVLLNIKKKNTTISTFWVRGVESSPRSE